MAPTKALKKATTDRKVTSRNNNHHGSVDMVAIFRQRAKALMPGPRVPVQPGDPSFVGRITRTTDDGFCHVIQMERMPATEAGDSGRVEIVDMEGDESLFHPPAPSTTSRAPARRTSTASARSTRRKATAVDDEEDYHPAAQESSEAPVRRRRTKNAAAEAAKDRADRAAKRSHRAERGATEPSEVGELCGLVDGLDVMSAAGAASNAGTETTRVSTGPRASASH